MKCKVCNNEVDLVFRKFRERQFNEGVSFNYMYCPRCLTWQLCDDIENIGEWYGKEYLPHKNNKRKRNSQLKRIASYFVSSYVSSTKHIPTAIMGLIKKYFVQLSFIYRCNVKKSASIVDIGGGNGGFIFALSEAGYQDVTCVDLFADSSPYEINFIKGTIEDLSDEKKYDLITMHHSFEHMDNPKIILKNVKRLLKEGGLCLIRIPVSGSDIWEKYKNYDYQIDPPRHLWLYSIKSIETLCEEVGLTIVDVIYDTNPANYFISECFSSSDDSLDEIRYKWRNLNKKEKKKYIKMANLANKNGSADQVCIYIK